MATRDHTQRVVTVYGLASSEDGKIRYVGQTTYPLRSRLAHHLREAKSAKRRRSLAWIRSVQRKGYQIVAFVIDHAGVWNETEIRLIAWYRAHGARLVNATLGGEGARGYHGQKGRPKPSGFGAKISAARKGKFKYPMGEAAKKKLSAFNKGKKLSEVHKAKIGASHTGQPMAEAQKLNLSRLKSGKRWLLTEEQEAKRKIASALAATTPEVNARRSATMRKTLMDKRMWSPDGPQGNECDKISHLVIPYTTGRCLDIGPAYGRKCWPGMIGVDKVKADSVDIIADASDLSLFATESCDAILSSHCLEDIEDTRKALSEWWRVVKIGGHLVLYLPHRDLYPNVGEPGANPEHKHDFVPDDIISMIRAICEDSDAPRGFNLLENEVRSGGEEYSFFTVLKKTDARIFTENLWQRNPGGKKRVLVVRFGAIGDMVVAASVLPLLKEQGFFVTFCTTPSGKEILRENPFIDEWLVQEKDQVPNPQLGPYFEALRERYDRIINLCESMEGTLLVLPGRPQSWWELEARRKIIGKVNYLERCHDIAGVPYTFAPRFHPTDEERAEATMYRAELTDRPLVMWALSGSAVHKIYPFVHTVVAWLLERTNAHVLLSAGESEKLLQEGVFTILRKHGSDLSRVTGIAGEWPIRRTLTFAEYADVVVGPETGVLNAVSMLPRVPKVVMLSHSSHENLTKHWRRTLVMEPEKTPCWPCHMLHYTWDHCVKVEETEAALCASNISPERMFTAVKYALENGQKVAEAAD